MKTCLSHCEGQPPKNTQAIRKHSQKNADALLLEPTKKNKESIPKPLRNFSHQPKPKKKVSDLRNQRRTTNSGTKKLRRECIRKGRAPAGFASKPLQECSLNENVPQPLRGSATRQSVRKLRRERIHKGRAPAGFASKPLQECNLKNLETLLLEPLKTMKSCPIKTMKTCLSHCETSATRQSLRKLRRERIRKGRAPAGFASKPLQECSLKNLETLRLEPLKTMKSCLSHCETSATRQSLRKLRRECIRKGRAPAGFASCNLKNLETLLLEPLKTMKSCPSHCETAASRQSPRKLRRERIRKGRAPAGFASKPLQECSLKNLETLLLEPLKTMKSCPIKTMKTCLSHCETSATRQSLRKLRRERIRKGRAPAGFASKPLQECSLKNLETLRLEPLKTMKSCPSHCETSATRQSLRKLRRERIRKGRAPAGFASVQAIAELQPQKSRNVAFGTPKNNEIVPQPLRNSSHQAKPKKAASGAHPKRQSPSRFCVQAIAGVQPQKSRNVAFGTPKNNEIEPHKTTSAEQQTQVQKH